MSCLVTTNGPASLNAVRVRKSGKSPAKVKVATEGDVQATEKARPKVVNPTRILGEPIGIEPEIVAFTSPTFHGPVICAVVALARKLVIRSVRVSERPGATNGMPDHVTDVSDACRPG